MELDFEQDQEDLRDGIRSVLTQESPISLARAVAEEGRVPSALWKTFVELGWASLTVPEEYGGIGLGAIEAAILAEELGRVIAPGGLFPTVTQFVPAVRECGTPDQQARWLGAVAAGECAGSLAIAEASASFDPASVAATYRLDGDEIELAGTKDYVVEGDTVDELVVVAHGDAGVRAIVVPVADVEATRLHTLDPTRHLATIALDDVRVSADRLLGEGDATAALRRAVEEATLGLALEMVGTAQTILDVTLDYAKQRVQFDAPIGSFQAIKHKFADMLISLERARSTGYYAALTIAEDDPRRTSAVSVAKAAAGDCQRLFAKEGIQIHGGIGYTWEHDMHLLVKRVKTGEVLFGSSSWHRARIADALGV